MNNTRKLKNQHAFLASRKPENVMNPFMSKSAIEVQNVDLQFCELGIFSCLKSAKFEICDVE